jgi:hypothetical protein
MFALSMLTMILLFVRLRLPLNDTIMKLIKLLKAALHAAAVFLIMIVDHAARVIMREIEARYSTSHHLRHSRLVLVDFPIFTIFYCDIMEIRVIRVDVPHLLISSLWVKLLHVERKRSHHCDVFPSKHLMMPVRVSATNYRIRGLNNLIAAPRLNELRVHEIF